MVAPRDVRILPKKGGWGAGPLTLPGGIGYQYTYLLTSSGGGLPARHLKPGTTVATYAGAPVNKADVTDTTYVLEVIPEFQNNNESCDSVCEYSSSRRASEADGGMVSSDGEMSAPRGEAAAGSAANEGSSGWRT